MGGYAQYAKTQAAAVIPLNDTMDSGLATALATHALTAVYCTEFAIRLYQGDRVLIHAAAGGVGSSRYYPAGTWQGFSGKSDR